MTAQLANDKPVVLFAIVVLGCTKQNHFTTDFRYFVKGFCIPYRFKHYCNLELSKMGTVPY